ncbi:hypothetical protein ACFE04_006651 [Oxalis oulophora]
MCSNLSKTQALPLAIRLSSKPRCFNHAHIIKSQSLSIGSYPSTPIVYPCLKAPSFNHNMRTFLNFARYSSVSLVSSFESIERSSLGFKVKSVREYSSSTRVRSYSNANPQRGGQRSNFARSGKPLPWLNKAKEGKRFEKGTPTKTDTEVKKLDKPTSSWIEATERLAKLQSGTSSLNDRVETEYSNVLSDEDKESRNDNFETYRNSDEENEMEEEEEEGVDPRWDKIKRVVGVNEGKPGSNKPEVRRWSQQDSWGKKTWREATKESTMPKMIGEGVYGVGPVLAALSSKRREFYTLYVQQGLDMSSNIRKKKDKRGFEKVLRMAEKIGLAIKEVPKHDLNMIADNRPHQGLVLDASPLEMVKIMELEPVSIEEDKGSLWLALDEVTDPQNLGAIIRSAYFFGATGIVLCAKNSAPLSGVVSKASAGALELMELRYCKNMMNFLLSSAENGWRVLGGSVSSKAVSLNDVVPGAPTILVLGSEGTGLRPLVERSCTELVRIAGNIRTDDFKSVEETSEGSGKEFHNFLAVESLNVSVATGVLLHHLIGDNHSDQSFSQNDSNESSE